MVTGADALQRTLYKQNAVDGPQFKLEHDPRITRIGHWLRKTNIDELPQLINVLRGHMSLIGPRPSPFRENQICVPWRQARLSVQPGITGLWQICRHERDAGDFHQWIYFDILYVRHLSFWLDLKILLATLATFGGRWSVAVSRMIPNHKPYEERTLLGMSNRAPVMDEAALPAASARYEPSFGSM
jgi:lipopolysaccharide/colanic/teichoic acid biosynthesis glycosyltransferase